MVDPSELVVVADPRARAKSDPRAAAVVWDRGEMAAEKDRVETVAELDRWDSTVWDHRSRNSASRGLGSSRVRVRNLG